MAAYHWEARRRQIMLDRRQALQARAVCERRQLDEDPAVETSQKKSSPPCPDPDAQQPAPAEGTTDDRCPCNTDHVPNHSGKLMKRYSDFEYIQQW